MRTFVSLAASAALSFALFSPVSADAPPPPVCTDAAHALHFDGKAWSCDAIPGLLVAHAAYTVDRTGTLACSKNVWGGAACTVTLKNNRPSATLTCPRNTFRIDQGAIDGTVIPGTSSVSAGFIEHAYCYSKAGA